MVQVRTTDGTGPGGATVALHGTVRHAPRRVRTEEGWEIVGLVVAGRAARAVSEREDAPPGGPDEGILAVCCGPGASVLLSGVTAGEDVVVVGRLLPRRAARPEDDALELVADTVLARPRPGSGTARAAAPRIAP